MNDRKRLVELDKLHVWHPFTQMREWLSKEPLIIEKGRGNYLIDMDGRRYLDGVSSLWVTVHGHRKKEIDRAIKDQIDRIAHSTLLGLANVPSIQLAEKLAEIAPKGLNKVFYSDNGSTAVEIALKISFQYWEQTRKDNEKRKFVAFTGAYHGDTFGAMSVGEIDIFVRKYRPLLFEVFRSPYPYCYRCPLKKTHPKCKLACLETFEMLLREHNEEIAGCIIEPLLQGAAGMITSPPGFLKNVRRLTGKYGVHLIADEVATGFGRTGKMFACDIEGVNPDIICLGKGITGGYMPLAATLTTDKIYNAFLGDHGEHRTFFHGHTFTGNPLGCAAAIANLDVFKKERVIEKLEGKIKLFKNLLKSLETLSRVGEIRHIGLVAGIELVKDRGTKETHPAAERVGDAVCMEARRRGLIVRPLGDTIVIMPPLTIKDAELKRIVNIVRESIVKVTGT